MRIVLVIVVFPIWLLAKLLEVMVDSLYEIDRIVLAAKLRFAGKDAPDGIRTRGTFPSKSPDFQEKS